MCKSYFVTIDEVEYIACSYCNKAFVKKEFPIAQIMSHLKGCDEYKYLKKKRLLEEA